MKKTKENRGNGNNNLFYLIIGIILLVLVFFGVGVFLNKSGKSSVDYNNFEFTQDKNSGFWSVAVVVSTPEGRKLYNLETRYNPNDLESIPVDRDVMDFFDDAEGNDIRAVYLTIDPNNNNNSALALAAYDLSANLARVLGVGVEAACTSNTTDACKDRPIITCDSQYPVIYLKESEDESIEYEPHRCIVISGKDIGMVKSVDRLLFQWYGIMY